MVWQRLLVVGRPGERIADQIRAEEPSLEVTERCPGEVRPEDLARAEMLLTLRLPRVAPEQLRHLRWIQSSGAGVDGIVGRPGLGDDTLVTRVVGVFGERIAEYVLARALALAQGLPALIWDQADRRWRPFPPLLLRGLRALVVGVGEIGAEVARTLAANGMQVVGVSGSGRPVAGVERVEPVTALDALLPACDLLVLVLPLTPDTRDLVDERRLARLSPGAWLINVGRGALIDQAALSKSLEDGRLGAACLDVFDQEPLPGDSPLWSLKNVLISPHIAGLTAPEEAATAFLKNWRRLRDGEPLLGQVNRQSGY